jgi:hypothetical protein
MRGGTPRLLLLAGEWGCGSKPSPQRQWKGEREGDPTAARRAGEPHGGRRNRGMTWCGGVFHASWLAWVCGGRVQRVLAVQAAGGARTPRGRQRRVAAHMRALERGSSIRFTHV